MRTNTLGEVRLCEEVQVHFKFSFNKNEWTTQEKWSQLISIKKQIFSRNWGIFLKFTVFLRVVSVLKVLVLTGIDTWYLVELKLDWCHKQNQLTFELHS